MKEVIKPGDSFVVSVNLDDPKSIQGPFICARIDKDFVYREGYDPSNFSGVYFKGLCFPEKYHTKLEEICRCRQSLKEAYDGSMGLVYALRNEIQREAN